ncbi:hypothetical protein D3C75_1018740 [compost metagenome]
MEWNSQLFILTGASGSGKAFVFPKLRKALPEFEIFDLDWISRFSDRSIKDWVYGHLAGNGIQNMMD